VDLDLDVRVLNTNTGNEGLQDRTERKTADRFKRRLDKGREKIREEKIALRRTVEVTFAEDPGREAPR